MSHRPTILHLVDDTTIGGVTRLVDFIRTSRSLEKTAKHDVLNVRRGQYRSILGRPAMIVSHTTINWRSLPALIALRATHPGSTIIHVEHSYTAGFIAHNVVRKKRFLGMLKVAYSLFDRVVAVSHAQSKWIASLDLCSTEQLFVIPSCTDLSQFRALPRPKGPIRRFGAIGRLDRQKGLDLLIDAFKAVPNPDLRLQIIGEGDEMETLVHKAGKDSRIAFTGFQPAPTLAMSRLDAVIMPSRWEAFGLVAAETLAAKRALLCNRIDGLMDHADYGATYVDVNNQARLAAKIAELSETPQNLVDNLDARNAPRQEDTFLENWTALIGSAGLLAETKVLSKKAPVFGKQPIATQTS